MQRGLGMSKKHCSVRARRRDCTATLFSRRHVRREKHDSSREICPSKANKSSTQRTASFWEKRQKPLFHNLNHGMLPLG